jgi:hypothetical protein
MAVDHYQIPIIAAYTVFDKPIRHPRALSRYWPVALETRIDNKTANVIHVPFKKEILSDAISQFSHDNLPPGSGLGFYSNAAYEHFGIRD